MNKEPSITLRNDASGEKVLIDLMEKLLLAEEHRLNG